MKIKSKIMLLSFAMLVFSCENGKESNKGHENHSAQQEQKVYTCAMHPQIVRDKPGQCPICGMQLVEKITDEQKENNKELELLIKPTNMYVISEIATVKPIQKVLFTNIFATGYITYDTRHINTVSARVSGRIEKLYIKYRYQTVAKGQKLMDVYSKELETEQQNFLFILKNDAENLTLINASAQRLILLGLTQEQIDQIKSSDKIFYAVTIYSPYEGHLHEIISSNNGMENGNMSSSSPITQEFQIKEGMYISKGQTIFNIYDTRKVWALLNVYPDAQVSVKVKQKIKLEIDGLKSEEIEATIDFIEPVIRNNQKNITVRAYLNNSNNEIKIGAIVKAKTDEKKQQGLFVPNAAIVSLGLNDVVFLKWDGLFKTRKVLIGIRSGEWTEIISGIKKEDVIAENGQLLMDSESFIKIENK